MNNREKVKKYATMFGMEAEDTDIDTGLLEEEANRNEEYDYEGDPISIDLGGDDWEDDDSDGDDLKNEEGVIYEDKKITPDEEIIQEEAKAANLIKLSGTHINGYVSNMVNILNSGMIERTGSFIANDYQATFIEPAEEIISKCFAQDDTVKKFQDFRELLDQKSLMSKLAGTETTPFVYEGLQVTYLLALTASLSLVGISLQINGALPDTAKHIGFKAFNDILETIEAILSVKSSLGTKIYYTDTVVDIEDNPQASLYVNIKEVNPSIGGLGSVPAGESIGNIIEIRNNGALMDYLLVMKALEKMSFIASKIEFKDITSKVLRASSDILSIDMQNDNGEEALATIVETVRNDIIAVLDSDDVITGETPIEDGDNLPDDNEDDGDLPKEGVDLPDNLDDFNEDEVENIGSESLEITLNAIGQHFSDILHSKSFKIGAAVTGAYLLFNGIGKLCKYYVNKKIKENQDKYIEEKALKFRDEKELKEFIKVFDAALKRAGATISKDVKNKLPIYNMFCKICGDKKYKVDVKRWMDLYYIIETFNSGRLNIISTSIIDEPFDYKELDWYMGKIQVAFVKEKDEVKAIIGNDTMKSNLIINLDKRTGDKLADEFLDKLKKFATDAIDGGDNYELDKERFAETFSEYYWKEVKVFSDYAKEVVEKELMRTVSNMKRGCIDIDIEDIDMLPSITIGVIKMDETPATENVDYGYGYESFLSSVGGFLKGTSMAVGAIILGTITLIGLGVGLNKLRQKRLEKVNKKVIEDATYTFNTEEEVIAYLNKEKGVLKVLDKELTLDPLSAPIISTFAYLNNTEFKTHLVPKIDKNTLLSKLKLKSNTEYVPYRISIFDKLPQIYRISEEAFDNIKIELSKDQSDSIYVNFRHNITNKSITLNKTMDLEGKFGKFGDIVREAIELCEKFYKENGIKENGADELKSVSMFLKDHLIEAVYDEEVRLIDRAINAYYNAMGLQNRAKATYSQATSFSDFNQDGKGVMSDIVIPMKLVGGANV